jgi:hypothetical protein
LKEQLINDKELSTHRLNEKDSIVKREISKNVELSSSLKKVADEQNQLRQKLEHSAKEISSLRVIVVIFLLIFTFVFFFFRVILILCFVLFQQFIYIGYFDKYEIRKN